MRRCRAACFLAAVLAAPAARPAAAGGPRPVSAAAGVLMERHSAAVFWEKRRLTPGHPSRLTKVVAALVAARTGELGELVRVSPRAAAPGTTLGLACGERYTLENLSWACYWLRPTTRAAPWPSTWAARWTALPP